MLLVADENIPGLEACFAGRAEIRRIPGRQMSPDDVRHADILLVRSVTKVNRTLLEGSRVRYVGTCTIGRDHIDEQALEELGVAVMSAPGCNAVAVVEYVLTALVLLEQLHGLPLSGSTLGVIGCGQVGGRLVQAARQLGMNVVVCDPFLSHAPAPLLSLEELLSQARIVSLHVPLMHRGPRPTHHLLGARELACMRPDVCLVQTSRGGVVDEEALLQSFHEHPDRLLIMDVWQDEPRLNPDVLARATLATPHVAGYSYEGKFRGTWMIYQWLCKQMDWPMDVSWEQCLGERTPVALETLADCHSLSSALLAMVPLLRDDATLRAVQRALDPERGFDRLRRDYPLRFEFSGYTVPASEHPVCAQLRALGCQTGEFYRT